MSLERVAIFGAAGPVGRAVARELRFRDIPFRAVGRSAARLREAFGEMRQAETLAADLADPASAVSAASGHDTIIYAVGVPYNAFAQHPRLMTATVDAAVKAGVRQLVVVSSVYSYGVPRTRTVAESHPRDPATFKGRMRKEQEDIVIAAHKPGKLQCLIVHLPDFYGPYADLSYGNTVLRASLNGGRANWLGSPDKPHEFVFVPDTGPVLVELASRPDCYGEQWNFAGPGEIRGGEFMTLAWRGSQQRPRWRAVGRTTLRVLGLFNPLMKELVEMHYLAETPVILDDTKLTKKLGVVKKTSYEEGIRQTLAWMRVNPLTSRS